MAHVCSFPTIFKFKSCQVLPDLVKFMDSLHTRNAQVHKMIGQITPPENPHPSAAAKEPLVLAMEPGIAPGFIRLQGLEVYMLRGFRGFRV